MGRQINSRLVSTGAFDGLVAEKTYGRFTGGITAGTTPITSIMDSIPGCFNSEAILHMMFMARLILHQHPWPSWSI
jgi:hypothetical protein